MDSAISNRNNSWAKNKSLNLFDPQNTSNSAHAKNVGDDNEISYTKINRNTTNYKSPYDDNWYDRSSDVPNFKNPNSAYNPYKIKKYSIYDPQ